MALVSEASVLAAEVSAVAVEVWAWLLSSGSFCSARGKDRCSTRFQHSTVWFSLARDQNEI